MLIYKQRYKPRTTREFTKSDLTVYDSAGNTALNALTVYGKSEVVDGTIKSAGEGWATVDLGTLNWTYTTGTSIPTFGVDISDLAPSESPLLCALYTSKINRQYIDGDMQIARWNNTSSKTILITNSNYTDTTAFKTAMTGVLLAYQLADPTQGNAIAVKTDNGSGIDGTMAVFETGTPLRGITGGARDVMVWDGSAGTVTKNCAKVNASTLTWLWNNQYEMWQSNSLINLIKTSDNNVLQSFILTPLEYTGVSWRAFGYADKTYSVNISGTMGFKDINYDSNTQPDFDIIYELATPTTEQLTTAENDSIAALRTFTPQTHAQNNAQTEMTVDYTIRVPTI